jgi:hypothetical protein
MKLIFEEGIAFATSGVKYSYRTNFVSNFTSFVLLVLFVRVSLNGANFVLATASQPRSIGPLDRVLEHAVVFAPV